MKKQIAVILSVLTAACSLPYTGAAAAADITPGVPTGFDTEQALYVHAVNGSDDGEAWQAWQSIHDEDFNEDNPDEKYFFLPTSADSASVDIYNGFSQNVTVNGVTIGAGETKNVGYSTGASYSVKADGSTYTLKYMKSNAEAAIYVNNSDADGYGTELTNYLNRDKSLSAKATGAIVTPDGSIDNTAVKKIKGRGNTSWSKPKKGYNITYTGKVSIAGMAKNKKYSLLPNYQDDSLARNRFLYDLSDAVGMPYASDSRVVDFYVNGFYWGSYQMAEKVEAGSLVTDVDEDDYLNADGTVKDDFSFIAEVDASAGGDDYYVTCNGGVKITIKAPEIDPGKPGYDEVKEYVASKFNTLIDACRKATRRSSSVADLVDLESAAKLYLINELGKNWDSGVSSTFLTYKPDENGSYKFFGSPVWDYDNSLGNAVGVEYELYNMGVSDYQSYTGWWCRYKGKSKNDSVSYNIINNFANIKEIRTTAAKVWFEDFMPALNNFSGKTVNPVTDGEMYSSAKYFDLLSGSAEMNYKSGWLLWTSTGWIAPHNSIKKASFDFFTGTYTVAGTATRYSQSSYTDMYNYAADWMLSRAAWLSNEMYADYTGSKVKYDIDRDGEFSVKDITAAQRILAEFDDPTALQYELADVDGKKLFNIADVTYMQRVKAGMIPA